MSATKKMKIGILAPEMMNRGGIQSFMLRLSEVMHEAVCHGKVTEATCLTLNDSCETLHNRSLAALNVKFWGAERSKFRMIFYSLIKMPRQDVLVVGHIGLSPVAYWLQKIGKIRKYYVIIHGIEAWRRMNFMERRALLTSSGVVATTNFNAKECANINQIPLAKFKIIPLCSDENSIRPNPTFKLNGKIKLLCVARQDASEKHKGFEHIFKAIVRVKTEYPEIHLNMVGNGNDQSRLKSVANKLSIDKQVTFWGALTNEELVDAYRDCDIFVMPSKKEGFGIVFLEAMRWGKPCIGGRHGGTPEVIDHGKSGYLIEYGDVDTLASYIVELASNPKIRQIMGRNGQQAISDKFSKSRFYQNYVQLLTSGIN